ncbi:MAG: ATP-binding cassette domain-containing protein [Oscillospiraceae bacterium]|nr:ATP-binding cassette domain-containing protein [Oscillospiraceae bacterium]
MIQVNNVTKQFKTQLVLNGISVNYEAGKIHGIIGRNGSGKTVFLQLLCGLMRPTSGTVAVGGKVLGEDVDFAPDTGIIIENPSFLAYKSGYGNLKDLAAIQNRIQKQEIVDAMNRVGLDASSKKRVGKYSLGMRQRLGIAQAIMEHPKLLILDEPMNGLDAQGLEDIRELLRGLKAGGTTILLASHNPDDIETLCDTVCQIQDGALMKVSSW